MLISERDAASVIMRAELDTCPLLSLVGHCLVSGRALTGTLLVVAPVADFSSNSFSFEIRCVTLVRASRCVAANCDHFLVSASVDFVRAWSSSSIVMMESLTIFVPFDAFAFFLD